MAKDTGSRNFTEKGPITRSAREALSKKMAMSSSSARNRKSERLEKRTPPSLAVRRKSVKQKKIILPTPSTLRRSERTKNLSSSLVPPGSPGSKQRPKKHKSVKQSLTLEAKKGSEDGEHGVGTSSQVKIKRMDARKYRTVFKKPNRDCHEESNKMDRSTPEGGNNGGGKIEESFERSRLDCEEVYKDGILPSEDAKAKEMRAQSRLSGPVKELLEDNVTLGSLLPSNATSHETSGARERVQSDCRGEETLQMLVSRSRSQNAISNENLIRNCVGHDKGEKLISSKRKGTMVDVHSDVSDTLVDDDNCNLIADTGPSRLCGNTVGTNGPCSKRIRRISLSDVQRGRRKLINNIEQPSSKSEGEKLSTGNKEGKSGDPVERSRANNDESEKIRKQQRSLHLLLKPEIAKLCEILHLPGNVKIMVYNCLEYIMNNRQICTEPVSILQAFQLSLCWTAAALLKHKLDPEDSLKLAKRHLNFNCKIEEVNKIRKMMRKLKEEFLYHAGNYNVSGSPKASELSNRVYSNAGVAPKVELAIKNVSKSIKEGKLLLMQQEKQEKNLTADIEKEKADFERRYKIEWAAIQSCSPNDVMRTEKLKVFNSEYDKRIGELKRQHETCLKDLEAKQLEARRKFQESWPQHALLNLAAAKNLGTGVEHLQTCDQEQLHNGLVSDLVAEGKSFYNIVESMIRTRTGVGLSEAPDTNSPVVVLCSSPVQLQTPMVEHAGANEMDIMTSEDEPVSRDKCHDIAENEYDSQGNIIPKHSNAREQCSDGATCMAVEREVCENFSHESRNGSGQDTITLVLLSSNGEICDEETSDVPGGEVAPAVHKSSSSNDDQDEVPSSRQGKLDGTMLSKPVCGCSVEIKVNRFSDGVKNITSLNSQSHEEHIPSVTIMSLPNCENAAQIHEADEGNGSNNADTINSPLSDERIASLNSKSPQEHVHSINAICMPNCENSAQIYKADDDNGSNTSNNAVTLNSPLTDERIADGALVSVLDREVHVGMPGTVNFTRIPENVTCMNPPSAMEQISGGAVNVSLSDTELSRPCGTASPSNGPDGNGITLLNQPSLEKQHPDGVSAGIPAGQIPGEVPETSHKGATVSVLDREAPVGMPSTVNCTDYPENVTPLNSSSMDQISDGDSVFDGVLSSCPSGASSPSNGPAIVSLLNPPSLQQQIPDRVSLSIPDGQIPLSVPETSLEVAECQLTDSMVVDKSTTSDQQEGLHRTMTENILSQQTAVSRPVDLMEPLEQVQPSSSVESPPDQDTAREMQNSLVSSPVDIVPANRFDHVSLVMESPEQVQQLSSAEFLSSNRDLSNLPLATGIEHQPTNEDALSSPVPEASIEVPNQAVEQPASNLELDSHPHQSVVHLASNLELVSPIPGGVRTESSSTGNLSTPSEINNHPIQTATQSDSMIVPPLSHDPLKNELEKIRKLTQQNIKSREDMKLQLKSDFEKESEELRRKYEIKFQEIEVEFQKTRKNLDTHHNTVLVNKILAEAFRSKCPYVKESGASGMQQDASFAQQLFQLSRQQNATWPSLVAGPSSCGPPAAGLQSSYTTTSSQNMVPSIQATYNTSGIFSSVSAKLPNVNPIISSPSGNLQAGGEIRAPAPHLQPYRPSKSVPASSLCTVPHGMPSQPAPGNIPVTSPSFSQWLPQPTPTTYQSDPHRGHWPVSVGVLPTPNLPSMDLRMDANSQSGINLPNVLSRVSDLASLNLSRFGTSSSIPANPAHQATSPDLVCLSDDE